MISGHMDIAGILGRKLLSTDVTIIQEAAWKMDTFDVVEHIGSQSVLGTANCALVLVVFILLEVFGKDLPGLKS